MFASSSGVILHVNSPVYFLFQFRRSACQGVVWCRLTMHNIRADITTSNMRRAINLNWYLHFCSLYLAWLVLLVHKDFIWLAGFVVTIFFFTLILIPLLWDYGTRFRLTYKFQKLCPFLRNRYDKNITFITIM